MPKAEATPIKAGVSGFPKKKITSKMRLDAKAIKL